MSWAGWAAIGVTLLFSIVTFLRGFSEDRGASRVWRDMIERTLKRHEDELAKHGSHSEDVDRHWTPRERTDLNKKLDRIEELIIESMTPRVRHNTGNNSEL